MKFSEINFKYSGCCGGNQTWAEVVHPNGVRTEVHDSDDDNSTGPFDVTTWAGRTVLIGAQSLADQAAVEARLAADAALIV